MLRLVRYDHAAPTKGQRLAFHSGEPSLDSWLATQARQSLASRDAVTYLLVDESDERRIAGYFALSSGSIARVDAPVAVSRRAPEPIPAVLLGRFAIDVAYQGLGADLLAQALRQAVEAGALIGARVLFLHAVSEPAREFYLHHGFEPSPVHRSVLMRDLRTIAASVEAADAAEVHGDRTDS
jgi:GNAT superfamily N-acetyltransferase